MDARKEVEPTPRTMVEKTSDREVVVTRTFNGPARILYEAWTKPELLKRWWVPKSIGMTFLSCEVDVRTGGSYRFEFGHPSSEKPVAFFGKYLEVIPNSRLVWTSEESPDASVTTVTFEEKDGRTLLVMRERFPSKEAFDANHGMEDAMPETFTQLDELLIALGASAGRVRSTVP
jgi:uncharacterized protein YndB with AHSA1/START domain